MDALNLLMQQDEWAIYGGGQLLLIYRWTDFVGVPVWLANPFWLLAVIFGLPGKLKMTVILGGISLLFTFSLFHVMRSPNKAAMIMLPGSYCWFTSLILVSLMAIVTRIRR